MSPSASRAPFPPPSSAHRSPPLSPHTGPGPPPLPPPYTLLPPPLPYLRTPGLHPPPFAHRPPLSPLALQPPLRKCPGSISRPRPGRRDRHWTKSPFVYERERFPPNASYFPSSHRSRRAGWSSPRAQERGGTDPHPTAPDPRPLASLPRPTDSPGALAPRVPGVLASRLSTSRTCPTHRASENSRSPLLPPNYAQDWSGGCAAEAGPPPSTRGPRTGLRPRRVRAVRPLGPLGSRCSLR